MKTKTLSNITVGVKADGRTEIELHDLQNVEEEGSSCSEDITDHSMSNRYLKLEQSQAIGKYVMDFDPMLRKVSLFFVIRCYIKSNFRS